MSLATIDDAPTLPGWVGTLQPIWELSRRLERAGEFLPASFLGRAEAIMAAILTGQEVGQGPMWSLRSIYIVNGKPGMYSEAQRALVLGAGHELWPVDQSNESVTMAGRRRGSDHTTTITWTMADATRARLPARNPTWKDYPRQMLTARATSELCRLIFADVTGGVPSVEELRDGITLAPAELDASPTVRQRPEIARQPAAPGEGEGRGAAPTSPVGSAPRPPLPGEELDGDRLGGSAEPVPPEPAPPADLPTRAKLMAVATKAFPGIDRKQRETYRHALTALVTRERDGGPTIHFDELDDAELLALSARLEDVRAGRLLCAIEPDGTVVATSGTRQALVMPGTGDERWSVVIQDRA